MQQDKNITDQKKDDKEDEKAKEETVTVEKVAESLTPSVTWKAIKPQGMSCIN